MGKTQIKVKFTLFDNENDAIYEVYFGLDKAAIFDAKAKIIFAFVVSVNFLSQITDCKANGPRFIQIRFASGRHSMVKFLI